MIQAHVDTSNMYNDFLMRPYDEDTEPPEPPLQGSLGTESVQLL